MEQAANNSPRVAIVDDDPTIRRLFVEWLKDKNYQVAAYASGSAFLNDLEEVPCAVCLDVQLAEESGLDVLKQFKNMHQQVPVIMVTSENDVQTAVDAMRAGAYDYLVKPVEREQLGLAVARAVERYELTTSVHELRSQLRERHLMSNVVGNSAPMRELARQVDRVVDSDVAVAIFGESGTGKELVARAIHHGGRRGPGPFVAINCAAIPESLHESELFGHERGAFTGAHGVHQGRFEQAHGGTLFLDEVGEMSALTQASLLRTLQERSIRRVGGSTEIKVDVRVICATHRDLQEEVKAGRFREDLYFRLVVYPIRIAPLRERTDDIPALINHFLQKFSQDVGRTIRRVSPEALQALSDHQWAGNVRELENVVHRAMLACDGDEISLSDLPPDIKVLATPGMPAINRAGTDDLSQLHVGANDILPMRELERRAIKRALKATEGSVEKAAKLLGMGRATLYRRLAHYDAVGREIEYE